MQQGGDPPAQPVAASENLSQVTLLTGLDMALFYCVDGEETCPGGLQRGGDARHPCPPGNAPDPARGTRTDPHPGPRHRVHKSRLLNDGQEI